MPEIQIIKIPEDFRTSFTEHPDDSLRDVAGISTISIRPLFEFPDKVNSCVTRLYENALDEENMRLAEWFMPEPFDYFMMLDGSQGGDGFGICLAHLHAQDKEEKPVVKVDLLGAPGRITYGNDFKPQLVEDIIRDLLDRGFNIKILGYDRATDISSILRLLEPKGGYVEAMSIDRCTSYPTLDYEKTEPPFISRVSTKSYYDKPMTELRDIINAERLIVPYHRLWSKLPYTFEHDNAKRVVKKNPGTRDDLGQAVGGAVFLCLMNTKYTAEIKEWKEEVKPDRFEQDLDKIKTSADIRAAQLRNPQGKNFDRVPEEEEIDDDFIGPDDFRYYL